MIAVCSDCKFKDKIKQGKCSKGNCTIQYGWDTRLYSVDCKEFEFIEKPKPEQMLELY